MASLADFLNPTFLMFLGILLLVVALLVVYFESKTRDQNHKIASMLSLVSTLAEDMNGVKMGLNHLAIRSSYPVHGGGNIGITPIIQHNDNLIEVSDDDEENDDDYDDEDDDYDNDNESIHSEQSNDSNNNIKIFKLNISQDDSESEDNLDLDETTDLDCDFEPVDEVPHVTDEYVEEVLDLKYDETKDDDDERLNEPVILSSSDLKTISINLGDESNINETNVDYRKLQIPKLRSIVIEKGLASNSDATKLKKPELLKLLGVE
jgi:hypothetical protein